MWIKDRSDPTLSPNLPLNRGQKKVYRHDIDKLAVWCSQNNLVLNTKKTKELITDVRRYREDLSTLYLSGDTVGSVYSFKFLGTHITEDLTWTTNTTAPQRVDILYCICTGFTQTFDLC